MRVALLSYRSKPHCGGQGVYVRHVSRELALLGHEVEVISGPPFPELDDVSGPGSITLTTLAGLDLYREPDPFRWPHVREFRSVLDLVDMGLMLTAAFPEPLTFSLRALAYLQSLPADRRPDVVHDNQTLGYGVTLLQWAGYPVVGTCHHPITVDRRVDLEAAQGFRKRFSTRRWYSFLRMQGRVIRRLPVLLTVSGSSEADIVRDFDVDPARVRMIPLGVDATTFTPRAAERVADRIVATASADTPIKGVVPLLEAVAKVRTERDVELVVVGAPKPGGSVELAIERLGLEDAVRFVTGVSEAELVDLYASAAVGVVPSLYEGFSLPAVELMSCATPLVVTLGGALPEVVGPEGEAALRVPPGDPEALAAALTRLLDDPAEAAAMGARGRARVLELYTWRRVAERTADVYAELLEGRC